LIEGKPWEEYILLNRTNATQNAMTIQRGGVEHPHPDLPRALIFYTVELFFFVPPFRSRPSRPVLAGQMYQH
jgi:hypothetical protein